MNSGAHTGGIVGYLSQGSVENCYNMNPVIGTSYVGGIVGTNAKGHIENCYNTGIVVASGNCAGGGIAGVNIDAAITIVNCYNIGEVRIAPFDGVGYGGGIAGRNIQSSIKNCYNAGFIVKSSSSVEGVANLGGIAGSSVLGESNTIEHAYWLADTAAYGIGNTTIDTGCTSMTDSEMKSTGFIQTLNSNVGILKTTYPRVFSWGPDTTDMNYGYPVFIDSPASYTLTIEGGGIGATQSGNYATGTIVSISAGTRNGYTFNGWTSSGGGSFDDSNAANTTFTMPASDVTISAAWKENDSDNNDPDPSTDDPDPSTDDPDPSTDVPAPPTDVTTPSTGGSGNTNSTNIIINGQTRSAGTTRTETGSDGRRIISVIVDSDKLNASLASEHGGTEVIIPFSGSADAMVGVLTGKMVRTMENKDATLIIQTSDASYTLPASLINIDAIAQQFGTAVSLSDITVSVSISATSDKMNEALENARKDGGFTIVTPSVDFNITCTYGDKSVSTSIFNAYVERTIAIPEGVDPSKITTGIIVSPDGSIRHVRTRVTVIDNKYYAVINSLTNSTYSVIWNPIEFSDVAEHWAKNTINNIGSRLIVAGVDDKNYAPEKEITRAEFAAIIVRALGLEPGMGSISFNDITQTDWYYGYIQTAASYGIVKGYSMDTYGPNDTITREQAVTMIARAMKITGLNEALTDSEVSVLLEAYLDETAVSDYAKSSIAACLKTDIVIGRAGNTLAPKANITRAEAAVLVERLLINSGLI